MILKGYQNDIERISRWNCNGIKMILKEYRDYIKMISRWYCNDIKKILKGYQDHNKRISKWYWKDIKIILKEYHKKIVSQSFVNIPPEAGSEQQCGQHKGRGACHSPPGDHHYYDLNMVQLPQKMQNIFKKWEKNAKNALTSHYANGHGDRCDKWVKKHVDASITIMGPNNICFQKKNPPV